jgi:glutamate racemase
MKTIGVFDSGVGGKSVANAIQKAIPNDKVIYVEDRKNIPYGTKTPAELKALTLPILNKLSKECDVIVIACNTVTTTIIEDLRTSLPVPLIGLEPMVKPAAEQTKTGVIAVCATPTTLASKRYQWLKEIYAKGVKVIEPDCSDWTSMIESNQVNRERIQQPIEHSLAQGADVIVLGCTHYHWIEDLINDIVQDKAQVLQPEQPVIKQLKKVLKQQL